MAIVINPLEWREPTDHPQDYFGEGNIAFIANGLGGRYMIQNPEPVKLSHRLSRHELGQKCVEIDGS